MSSFWRNYKNLLLGYVSILSLYPINFVFATSVLWDSPNWRKKDLLIESQCTHAHPKVPKWSALPLFNIFFLLLTISIRYLWKHLLLVLGWWWQCWCYCLWWWQCWCYCCWWWWRHRLAPVGLLYMGAVYVNGRCTRGERAAGGATGKKAQLQVLKNGTFSAWT